MEEWRPKEPACPVCRDTGIVIPRGGHMPIELGSFCSECEEGVARWRETIKVMIAAGGAADRVIAGAIRGSGGTRKGPN